jgi:hypothetical protein
MRKFIVTGLFLMLSFNLFAQVIPDEKEEKEDEQTEQWKSQDSLYYQEPEIKVVERDSAYRNKKNPTTAALLSAVLPGAGQAYNEKYWKIPIVYFISGGLVYWADYNNKQYHRYLKAYVAVKDEDETTVDEFEGAVPADNLLHYKNSFRRNRDITVLLIGAAYLFNIIDASVDAHFSDYDVGEDLSLNISPVILNTNNQKYIPGINLSLRFK